MGTLPERRFMRSSFYNLAEVYIGGVEQQMLPIVLGGGGRPSRV